MSIGTNIRNRRKELGMTQEELAEKMGYKSKSSINKIELGENDIPQSKVVKFAEILHTSIAYLMGWNQDQIDAASEIQNDANAYSDEQEDVMKSLMEEISEMVLVPEDMKRIKQYAEMMQAADLRKIADYFYKVYELQLTESEIQEVYEYATYIKSKRNT